MSRRRLKVSPEEWLETPRRRDPAFLLFLLLGFFFGLTAMLTVYSAILMDVCRAPLF